MTLKTLEEKRAHIAKTRLSNFAASLRLEGFDMTPEDAILKYKTREEAVNAILGRSHITPATDDAPPSNKETP